MPPAAARRSPSGRPRRAVLAAGDADAHQRRAGVAHDRAHVREVEVDQPGHRDQVGDALDALAQHVVGDAEGVDDRGALLDDLEQPVVRDDDQRVDLLAQRARCPARPGRPRLRPSKANGRVTTPTVSAPSSRAISAITGRRRCRCRRPCRRSRTPCRRPSAPPSARRGSRRGLAADRGSAPAPRPARDLGADVDLDVGVAHRSAWASVLTAMNSTPRRPASTMRLTALVPPPPTPTTLMTAR